MVRKLRRKLGENGSIPRYFSTEPRDGHRMDKDFLPSLNLAGVDLVPGGQLGNRVLGLHRL